MRLESRLFASSDRSRVRSTPGCRGAAASPPVNALSLGPRRCSQRSRWRHSEVVLPLTQSFGLSRERPIATFGTPHTDGNINPAFQQVIVRGPRPAGTPYARGCQIRTAPIKPRRSCGLNRWREVDSNYLASGRSGSGISRGITGEFQGQRFVHRDRGAEYPSVCLAPIAGIPDAIVPRKCFISKFVPLPPLLKSNSARSLRVAHLAIAAIAWVQARHTRNLPPLAIWSGSRGHAPAIEISHAVTNAPLSRIPGLGLNHATRWRLSRRFHAFCP